MTIRPILPTDDPMAVSRVYEKHGFVCSGDCREDEIGGKTVREVRYVLQKPL